MTLPTRRSPRERFSDDQIRDLVHRFYAKVQEDPMLAPVFESRIEDWGPHLLRMQAFWTAVLRGEGTYQPGPKGPPPVMHRAIAELEPAHFARWLELFAPVAEAVFDEQSASFVIDRAHGMGRSLSAHLTTDRPFR